MPVRISTGFGGLGGSLGFADPGSGLAFGYGMDLIPEGMDTGG